LIVSASPCSIRMPTTRSSMLREGADIFSLLAETSHNPWKRDSNPGHQGQCADVTSLPSCAMLFSCLAYASTMKTENIFSTKMSLDPHWTAQPYK
jgi:hypothetical protein